MKYALKQELRITVTAEEGEVVGRAEYTYAQPSYLLRYKAADGRATEQWWPEDAVEPA